MTKEEQFEIWWKSYPRRVAKGNARKAFAKAIEKASMEELLDGITRYVANKPGYCDYAHPASWLNAERWTDEYEVAQPRVSESVDQHRRREFLMMQYRNARDEGNHEKAAQIRAQLN